MRYAFVSELSELASKNKDIVLLTGDLGFTVFEEFAKTFPKQFFNAGIAESNMMGVAAGLALGGKSVFAYSIATFVTYRPYEFIRNDISLHNLPVTIVGSGAGLSYGDAGPTHHALEDISIMRSLPNMTILCPADPVEARWATKTAYIAKSPVYLRLGKRGEPDLYSRSPKLKLGISSLLRRGTDFCVFATGNIVFNTLSALEICEKKNLSGSLYSIHTIKPIDKKVIESAARETKYIITVEEHRKIGGLGSAVSEIISQLPDKKVQLLTIGVGDNYSPQLGSQEYLRDICGISAEKIAIRIKEFVLGN